MASTGNLYIVDNIPDRFSASSRTTTEAEGKS